MAIKINLIFHPLSVISFCITWAFIVLFNNDLLFLFFVLFGVLLMLFRIKSYSCFKNDIINIFLILSFVIFFNLIFNRFGDTYIFKVYKFFVTKEALLYGLINGLKLGIVIYISNLMFYLLEFERFVIGMSDKIPKLSLVIWLSFLNLEMFKNDLKKSFLVLNYKKLSSKKRRLFSIFKGSINIWKIMLIQSLDRSYNISESLYARAFMLSNKRTNVQVYKFKPFDFVIIYLNLTILVYFLVYRLINNLNISYELLYNHSFLFILLWFISFSLFFVIYFTQHKKQFIYNNKSLI